MSKDITEFAKEHGFKVKDNQILLPLGETYDIEYGVLVNIQQSSVLYPYVLQDGVIESAKSGIECYTPEMVISAVEVGDKSYVIDKKKSKNVEKLTGFIYAFKFRDLGTIALNILDRIYEGVLGFLPPDISGEIIANKVSELEEKLAEVDVHNLPENMSEKVVENILDELKIYTNIIENSDDIELPGIEIPTIVKYLIINKQHGTAMSLLRKFGEDIENYSVEIKAACYKLIKKGEIKAAKAVSRESNIEIKLKQAEVQELHHRFLENAYDSIAQLSKWQRIKPKFDEERVSSLCTTLAKAPDFKAIRKVIEVTGLTPKFKLSKEEAADIYAELVSRGEFENARSLSEWSGYELEIEKNMRKKCIELLRDKYIHSAENLLRITGKCGDWLMDGVVQECYMYWLKRLQFGNAHKIKAITEMPPSVETLTTIYKFYADRGYWDLGVSKLKRTFSKEFREHYKTIQNSINE